jgi:uncharacterized protein with PIN domain
MKQAVFRFYAELNDLTPPSAPGKDLVYRFMTTASAKDVIEALGVPHTEVDLILINGQPVEFSYRLQDGDRVSVYPVFRTIDIGPQRLHGPIREARFVLDDHLGKLAAYLRALGFDSLYQNRCRDEDLARISTEQNRILLSRDRGLLKRSIVTYGYLVRETQPCGQLAEIVKRFNLFGSIAPFRRCLHCNSPLRDVPKDLVCGRLPQQTKQLYEEFTVCPGCDRVYWKGTHYEHMKRVIASMVRLHECRPAA